MTFFCLFSFLLFSLTKNLAHRNPEPCRNGFGRRPLGGVRLKALVRDRQELRPQRARGGALWRECQALTLVKDLVGHLCVFCGTPVSESDHGTRPVASSQITKPREYMSAAEVSFCAAICSGAIQCSVPPLAPSVFARREGTLARPHHLRPTEITNQRLPTRGPPRFFNKQHIGGLQVTMNDPGTVDGLEPVRSVAHELRGALRV